MHCKLRKEDDLDLMLITQQEEPVVLWAILETEQNSLICKVWAVNTREETG